MERTLRIATLLALSIAMAPAVAATRPHVEPERRGGDILPSRQALRLSRAHQAMPAPGTTSAAVTVDDVGDVDSFGRNLKWLGITSAFITLDSTCDPASTDPCQVIGSAPGALTSFNFPDAARIKLPGKSAKSLMCYWFSPVINVSYANPTAGNVVAQLRYSPTLTVENPMLADPALIDPTTGAPFAGRLTTSMTSSEMFQEALPAGVSLTQRLRDSNVCMAGFLNRRMMIDLYGFTEAQADEFFKKPMTIRLNITGSARYVSFANMVFGLRVIGD